MNKQGVLVAACVALLLAVVPSGRAEAAVSTIPTGRYAIDAPQIAGSAVAWTEPANPGYRVLLHHGGKTRTLREVRRPDVRASVLGSEDGLLLQEATVELNPHGFPDELLDSGTLLQSPVGVGAFVRRGPGCLYGNPQACALNSAIDGDTAFIPAEQKAAYRAEVVSVKDGTVLQAADGVGSPVSIAGDKLAWVSANGKQVVVSDWRTNTILYRIPYPPDAQQGGDWKFSDVAVQPDGTAAFAYPVITKQRTTGARYAWASPTEPAAHRMSIATKPSDGRLLLRENRMLFTRQPSNAYGSPATVYSARLGEHARPLVVGVTNPPSLEDGRLAWSERTCAGTRVASAPINDLEAQTVQRIPRCRLRLARPLRANKAGQVALRPRCEGLDRACYPLSVRAVSSRQYGRRTGALRRGSAVFNLRKSRYRGNEVLYQLTRRAQRQLVKRKRLRIKLRIALAADVQREATFTISSR